MRIKQIGRAAAAAFLLTFTISPLAFAAQGGWQVSRVTGEVWISSSGAQKVSLTSETSVQAGDDIRTGRNGRVLLTRGQEVIMISPNSEIAIPESSKDGMATTISQRAGSATFEVEKRNVQHFQVETPYLAAVVKGTQFQVSVTGSGSRVNVTRGAVDVSDFKSGQHALIMPGQVARVSALGASGLSIVGPGAHSPIIQGTPRAPAAGPEPRGLRGAQNENRQMNLKPGASARLTDRDSRKAGTRITAPAGDVKLDFSKVTKGLAGSAEASAAGGRANGTVWNSSDAKSDGSMTNANGQSASAASAATGAAASASGGGGGNGNGNGNGGSNAGGNGNGNAYGLVGKTVDGVSNGVGKALGHLKK